MESMEKLVEESESEVGSTPSPPPETASGGGASSESEEASGGEQVDGQQIAQVFDNPLLLEMILKYGLYNNIRTQDLRRKDVVNFRQVSKSWNVAVSNVLEGNGEVLYTVKMTAANSLNGSPDVQRNGKTLDNFVRVLSTRQPHDAFADFRLKMEMEVFRRETYDHLLACLGQCGHHLVQLDLVVPKNGGSFPGIFPNTLDLFALRKLIVALRSENLEDLSEAETQQNTGANATTLLLMSLLNSSNNLEILKINGTPAPGFQFLKFPPSLTSLRIFYSEGKLELLECLMRNRLPELKVLDIWAWNLKTNDDNSFAEGLMFHILQNLGNTLQRLDLHVAHWYTSLTLRFPVMENLERLVITGMYSEVEMEKIALPAILPKLRCLSLEKQSEGLMNKWISGTPAPQVTKLELDLDDEGAHSIPVPLELMKRVQLTFPNITDLKLSHSGTQFAGLQHIFREMRQLKRLSIDVAKGGDVVTSDHWDSLLIGVPLELVVGLAACPRRVWRAVKLDIENEPSIRMLTKLKYFFLKDCRDRLETVPLISELTFYHAFNGMAMANLEQVKIYGKLNISNELVEEWKQRGSKIEVRSRCAANRP